MLLETPNILTECKNVYSTVTTVTWNSRWR